MAPALDGLLETAIYVDDVDRAVDFYREVVGLAVVEASERLTAMSAGPRQVLLVCRRGASAALPLTPHDASGSQHIAFAIRADALDEWLSWLNQRGVPILESRHWDRGGVSVYFSDPDGHVLELATPGVWPVY